MDAQHTADVFSTDRYFESARRGDVGDARKLQHQLNRALAARDWRDGHFKLYLLGICPLGGLAIFVLSLTLLGSFSEALACAIVALILEGLGWPRRHRLIKRRWPQIRQLEDLNVLSRPVPTVLTAEQKVHLAQAYERYRAQRKLAEDIREGVVTSYAAHDMESAMQELINEGLA